MKTVCFTGHRPDQLGGYNENNPITQYVKDMLLEEIYGAILNGYTRFIWGGALGVDTYAAEAVLWLKENVPDKAGQITLELYSPFEGQESKWPEHSKARYRNLMQKSDKVITLFGHGYAGWKMLKRDEAMVDQADLVIAVWNGTATGGTAHTVKYAITKGKPIVQINPKDAA